jgi:glutamate--cysteine ligase
MTAPDHITLTRQRLLGFFEDAFTPRDRWQVGMELEKMGRNADTGRPFPYDGGSPSVREVLEAYREARGGNGVYEGHHLIGLDGPWGTISLEPAGQVEWSSKPFPDLGALDRELRAHLETLDRVGRETGVAWLDVALDPIHAVADMPWMPKARYAIMRPYMGKQGRLAHRMMTQTASIQVAFDFQDAGDWARKFRAAALLSPLAVALFANSSRIDGKDSGYRSYRQRIWRETDPDRCGLPAVVFERDFGLEEWLEWVCRVPALFVHRARGLVSTGGTPFCRLLEQAGCDALKFEDWELHLSSIFTDVRSYSYIEVRSADLVPDRLALSVPTFWTGILYQDDAVREALELGATIDDHSYWLEAMDVAARDGLDGTVRGRSMRQLASEALRLSAEGLANGAACATGLDDPVAPLRVLARERDLNVLDE